MRLKMRFLLAVLISAGLLSCGRPTPTPQPDYLRVPGQDAEPPPGTSQPSERLAKYALDSYFEALQNHNWNAAWNWRGRSDPNTLCGTMLGPQTYEEFRVAAESTSDERGDLTSWEYETIAWDYQPRQGGGFYRVRYRVFRDWSSGYRELVYGELAPAQDSSDTYRICWLKEGSY